MSAWIILGVILTPALLNSTKLNRTAPILVPDGGHHFLCSAISYCSYLKMEITSRLIGLLSTVLILLESWWEHKKRSIFYFLTGKNQFKPKGNEQLFLHSCCPLSQWDSFTVPVCWVYYIYFFPQIHLLSQVTFWWSQNKLSEYLGKMDALKLQCFWWNHCWCCLYSWVVGIFFWAGGR